MTHLILIGFKHTGKTSLGRSLAERMGRGFIDLDEEIVRAHQAKGDKHVSCREILNEHGEEYFRELEHETLQSVLDSSEDFVLAVGGGTPMTARNQDLMKTHHVVHVSAPKSIVFERIMINGKPAFFPKEADTFDSFQQLWSERIPVFDSLAHVKIENNDSLEKLTDTILSQL